MRDIEQMSDDELRAELAKLQSVPLQADRRVGAPKRVRSDVKPKSRRSSWQDTLFGDADGKTE